ncbi:hypothetical protein P7K49_040763, partial [Saguinus oedipus]
MTCFIGGLKRKCQELRKAKFNPSVRPLKWSLSEGGSSETQGPSAVPQERALLFSCSTQWTQYLPPYLLSPPPRGTWNFWDPCRCS